jgi:hypothetical protein
MNLRVNHLVVSLLVLSAGPMPFACAQTPADPTPDQLMQLMRSQPGVDFSAPVTAMAAFDPSQVRPGEKAVYRVMFNATTVSVSWPYKIPAPPELKIRLNASGQTMQAVGGEYQNIAMFDFDVRADAAGRFTVPEFAVQVYGQPVSVPTAQLDVNVELPESHEPARQLLVEPSATNVFVGENFNVSVLLPVTAAGGIQGVSEMQLNGDGFVVDKNAVRQSIRPVILNGRTLTAYIYETRITPIAAGTLNLSAQGFTTEFGGRMVINGQVVMPGGSPQLILLDSEPVTIHVRPLPTEGELPGFNGAVGSYTCDPPSLATNFLKVGEPAQLNVVIRGRENLGRINPPLPSHAEGWQIFPAVRDRIVGDRDGPGASFQYTLIPLTAAVRTTPAIPFSCFDPGRGQYIDLTIPALPVTVLAGAMATNADASLMLSENTTGPEPGTGLSKLAASPGRAAGGLVPLQMRGWFPLVQIFPVLGFCGLWLWDRRRRHLERHPEIVRRRAARRALRRERRLLEQAAASGDAETFVRRAINALQIATAPHYPAAPRALVCGDVLQILTVSERGGKPGETVRRFFAAAAAAEFANQSESQTALLAESPALAEVVATLEARL